MIRTTTKSRAPTGFRVATNATFSGTLLWDSGATASRLQNHIPYGGTALSSDLQCFWRVKTWDTDSNEGAWSATNTFTVGLLDNSDWSGASWIKRKHHGCRTITPTTANRPTLDAKPIERATVYISSVHKYALYVNGSLVGKGPSYHHPEYQYYNAFDITDLLQSGAANQFAVFKPLVWRRTGPAGKRTRRHYESHRSLHRRLDVRNRNRCNLETGAGHRVGRFLPDRAQYL